jgi:PAS domain S-box-containing protein
VFHVSTTISAIKDRAGNVVGSSNVARDISDRKRVEEELRQSLKEVTDLKAAMDEHAIVAITDPQGRITYVNDKFCAISQYSREELLGQDHRIINSGYHPKEFIRGLWRTIGSGKVWHGEIKNRAKDGSYYWVDTTIVPFLNDQGKPRQYVAIRNDITERKRALEALAESEEQFHTMADAIPQLAWMAQPDGSIFWYNQRWYDYTGATPAEMEGGGWEKVHHPQWLPEVRKKWKSSVAEGKRFEMDFPLRGADGDYRWFLTRVVPLKDSSGRVLRWFGTNTDVSEMRRAEQEIQRLNSELEQRVQIRTAELEAANKELEAFSYTISHDLRAPLRAVDGFSQAVLQDFGRLLPTEGHRYLQVIRSGAQNMGMLIDDLLTFSRLSRTALNKQMVDMSRLVGSTLSELDPLKQGRDIVVRQSELPPCLGDPALLKQVWVNLLSNAFKYTQKRAQAVVEIGSEAGAEGETAVYFVRDNGTGFNMKYVDKLFGVFQRLHRAEDFEGTGVGLAIVQRVIQRHGGRIWAKAEVDHGATFFFTLQEKNQPKDPS